MQGLQLCVMLTYNFSKSTKLLELEWIMFNFGWIIETFTVDAITCICFHAYMRHDAYTIACFFYMLLNLHNACSTWCIYMTCFIFPTIHSLILILPHKLNEDCKIWLWACRSSWNAEVLRCFVSVSITCVLLETCYLQLLCNDSFPNKVDIQFNVLCPSVEDMIVR